MPNRKLTKEENQPPISTLLPNCTKNNDTNRTLPQVSTKSATNTSANVSLESADLKISAQTETSEQQFIEVKSNNKRKRRNRSSGSPKKKPSKKPIMENPAIINKDVRPLSPKPDTEPPLTPIPEITLSPELLELERRLNKTMVENIANGIKAALKPLQQSIDKVQKSSDLIIRQENRIKELSEENFNLHCEVSKFQTELREFKNRLSNLENKSLECNLIIKGVDEPENETTHSLKERIYWLMADTVDNPVASERLASAKSVAIRRCRRLGRTNQVRPRPISVEFETKTGADAVYEQRFYFTSGVFVDREFNQETERSRRTLRPILRAARQKPEFRFKSRMEGSKLVIDGKRYGENDLDKLPQKLSPLEVTMKSNEDTTGFFGELCPFSNFYPAKFTHNGVNYHSGEQLIQYQKAIHCGDTSAADRILATTTAIACKQLSYSIKNYKHQSWIGVAHDKCIDGLRAKFVQNPQLLRILLSTGNKLLVESSKDSVWGTGVPLFRWDCLQKKHWNGNGLLGELLMEIRDSCKETASMEFQNSPT